MRSIITLAALAAVGVLSADRAQAQGPIREGLRRTGEIAVEGTRRVVQGAGEIAAGTVRGAGRAVGAATEATANGVRALTPGVPVQARAGANLAAGDLGRDARWRFQQHNGEWWYYTPQNAWMYHRDGQWNRFAEDSFQTNPALSNQQLADGQLQGEHTTGFRGTDDQHQQQGLLQHQGQQMHQQVRVDRYGREYICENGRPVYLDQGQQHQSAYRGEMQPSLAPEQPQQPGQPQPPAQPEQSQQGANVEERSTIAPATPQNPAELQGAADANVQGATVQPQADASASSGTTGGRSTTEQPAAPREINNNPDTAREGDPTTQGTGDGDTLR